MMDCGCRVLKRMLPCCDEVCHSVHVCANVCVCMYVGLCVCVSWDLKFSAYPVPICGISIILSTFLGISFLCCSSS